MIFSWFFINERARAVPIHILHSNRDPVEKNSKMGNYFLRYKPVETSMASLQESERENVPALGICWLARFYP
jgi:hypothetical protein